MTFPGFIAGILMLFFACIGFVLIVAVGWWLRYPLAFILVYYIAMRFEEAHLARKRRKLSGK